ncbi:MAG: glutamate racemase [Legionella sp.]|uniref:glutamate racemase n=1 Tax=Legionella sp. TaxID=459 RepID=UPI0039E52072
MNLTQLAIGVFDSGMGGLTVLRALKESLPQESFIYLGDTARLPYGTKSPDTVKQYAMQMAKLLVERRIKALVIACNTATTAALPYLQSMLPDLPVLGVVVPGASAAVAATKNQRIAVLATETTIASKAYQELISHQLPKAVISTRACSVLVALAEEGMTDNLVAQEALKHYLDGFQDEDTILLGCTHFPVFKSLLHDLLPERVSIVDSAHATAHALGELLKKQNLLQALSANKGTVHYLVTDSIKRFQTVGEIFLGEPLSLSAIELVDASPSKHTVFINKL